MSTNQEEQRQHQQGGGPGSWDRPGGVRKVAQYLLSRRIEAGLWLTRLMTLAFSLGFLLPIFPWSGSPPATSYYKAFMSNAATSALRLHQRLTTTSTTGGARPSLSREFLFSLLLEDSAHYLMFSLVFLFNNEPVTVALVPIALFALLHSASFSLTLLDQADSGGRTGWWLGRALVSLVELQSRHILRLAAFTEIFLMPLTVVLVFAGHVSLLTPFMYYRFLGLRYSSRRNPYTRSIFYELRVSFEQAAASPSCPAFAKGLVHRSINLVSGLAPAY